MSTEAQRVFITGATSGIGRALAEGYAREGALLGLVGRREERLQEVAATCRARGAGTRCYAVDVTDREALRAAIDDFVAAAGGADLVIANAGRGGPDRLSGGDPAPLANLMEVNVVGVLNTLVPFVPVLRAQGGGHLVAIASVAGSRALPGHAAYSASKAAVRTLLEGFGWALERYGIAVTCVNPGFVVSEMTASNDFPMPFLLETEEAARRIRRALRRRPRVYTFPLPMRVVSWTLRWLPAFVVRRLR